MNTTTKRYSLLALLALLWFTFLLASSVKPLATFPDPAWLWAFCAEHKDSLRSLAYICAAIAGCIFGFISAEWDYGKWSAE